jgi:hypothetical protein
MLVMRLDALHWLAWRRVARRRARHQSGVYRARAALHCIVLYVWICFYVDSTSEWRCDGFSARAHFSQMRAPHTHTPTRTHKTETFRNGIVWRRCDMVLWLSSIAGSRAVAGRVARAADRSARHAGGAPHAAHTSPVARSTRSNQRWQHLLFQCQHSGSRVPYFVLLSTRCGCDNSVSTRIDRVYHWQTIHIIIFSTAIIIILLIILKMYRQATLHLVNSFVNSTTSEIFSSYSAHARQTTLYIVMERRRHH